jgi:DNA topoisomerase-2
MPMWSLTEEKIDELIKQMNAKKQEHDALYKRHPFDLWNEDLDAFLIALDKYEE